MYRCTTTRANSSSFPSSTGTTIDQATVEIGRDLSVTSCNPAHPLLGNNSCFKEGEGGPTVRSYIGVSISATVDELFRVIRGETGSRTCSWRPSSRGRGSLSRGNGRRRIFDLETRQLEVKRRPYTGATPRELGVHRLRYLESTLCPSKRCRYRPAIAGIYVSMIYGQAGSKPPLDSTDSVNPFTRYPADTRLFERSRDPSPPWTWFVEVYCLRSVSIG